MPRWDDNFEDMTRRQANWIRRMYMEHNYSWRAIAEMCDAMWNGNWRDTQMAGQDICKKAMKMLGQNWEDWEKK